MMSEPRNEFLFNILMVNQIPFIRIGDLREFILLDQKVRIATFETNDDVLKFKMLELKYKDYIFKDGFVEPSFLADLLNIQWIKRYNSIIIW